MTTNALAHIQQTSYSARAKSNHLQIQLDVDPHHDIQDQVPPCRWRTGGAGGAAPPPRRSSSLIMHRHVAYLMPMAGASPKPEMTLIFASLTQSLSQDGDATADRRATGHSQRRWMARKLCGGRRRCHMGHGMDTSPSA
jgi:hypothetical protein